MTKKQIQKAKSLSTNRNKNKTRKTKVIPDAKYTRNGRIKARCVTVGQKQFQPTVYTNRKIKKPVMLTQFEKDAVLFIKKDAESQSKTKNELRKS